MKIESFKIRGGSRLTLPVDWVFLSACDVSPVHWETKIDLDVLINVNPLSQTATYEFQIFSSHNNDLTGWSIPHKIEHGKYLACRLVANHG